MSACWNYFSRGSCAYIGFTVFIAWAMDCFEPLSACSSVIMSLEGFNDEYYILVFDVYWIGFYWKNFMQVHSTNV